MLRTRHGLGALRTSALVIAVLGVTVSTTAAAVPIEVVTCGQVVDHSLRVANNLENCPDHGLVVGADGVTIDLGGHRIAGNGLADPGPDAGIRNFEHVGVTVRNGSVTGFNAGVSFTSNAQGVVTGIQATDNASGIDIANSSAKSVIKGNVASRNASAGIRVFGSTASVFQDNVVVGNTQLGIHVDSASGATFTKNRVVGNVQSGVRISGSDNVIKNNVISGNGFDGILLTFALRTVLKRNVVSGNGESGISFDVAQGDATIDGNRVVGNDDDGIAVGTSVGNVLKGNVVTENGHHGISAATNALTLTSNRADRNGFLGGGLGDDDGAGISVPAGTTNSGNKATGNDDPQECEPADLSCHVP